MKTKKNQIEKFCIAAVSTVFILQYSKIYNVSGRIPHVPFKHQNCGNKSCSFYIFGLARDADVTMSLQITVFHRAQCIVTYAPLQYIQHICVKQNAA